MDSAFHDIPNEKLNLYVPAILKILKSADAEISSISPSEWAEKNRVMGSSAAVPGPFSFKNAPYAKEILNTCSQEHPARRIAIMKGVQIAMSTSVIQNIIGYKIAEDPNNMMLIVGHEDLIKDSTERIDDVIDSSGIRHLLQSQKKSAKKLKSGDTDKKKEFDGGYLVLGTANHKTLRQVSIQTMIVDDFDGIKSSTKEAGATTGMIEARTTAFAKKKKIYYISTPELKETSNIEPEYLKGDQRKWHMPCPCCDELITFEWETPSKKNKEEMAGITWKLDNENRLIVDSVGYTCQECGEFFDDSHKTEMLSKGKFIPTAVPVDPEYYSFHVSALNAPIYMDGWTKYVRDYINANPVDGKRNEKAHQTFVNLCLGETYEPTGESISANQLQKNIRPYEIDIIPEKLSMADGNGRIVMITCGSDLNGKEKDARLDWEIIAHSEAGQTYSINHGSIGTFIPRDKHPEVREHWTYEHGVPNSVWPEFEKIISKHYERDTGGAMGVFITGVDSGYMTSYAYQFVDMSNSNVVALKGKDNEKFISPYADLKTFKQSREKGNLFLVESNHTKDVLSYHMGLKWDQENGGSQPNGFMNFPTPSDGKYLFANFFSHFEAEHKIIDKNGTYRWLKKSQNHQNHLFDCDLYGFVVRDILLDRFFKEMKIKNGVWSDYVKVWNKKRNH